MKAIIKDTWWTRDEVKEDKDNLYFFGENAWYTSGTNPIKMQDLSNLMFKGLYYNKFYGNKTQAVIRGLPNAMPILTKKSPFANHFWSDNETHLYDYMLALNIGMIDDYIVYKTHEADVLDQKYNPNLIFPKDGFATGSAAFTLNLANKLVSYLNDFLFEFNIYNIEFKRTDHPYLKNLYGVIPKYIN